MLLALHMLALGVVTIIFVGMIILHRRARLLQQMERPEASSVPDDRKSTPRPASWLAIHSSNPKVVQSALGMSYPMPCPWTEGITGEHEFFIGAPVKIPAQRAGLWGRASIRGQSPAPKGGWADPRCLRFLIYLLNRNSSCLCSCCSCHFTYFRIISPSKPTVPTQ